MRSVWECRNDRTMHISLSVCAKVCEREREKGKEKISEEGTAREQRFVRENWRESEICLCEDFIVVSDCRARGGFNEMCFHHFT